MKYTVKEFAREIRKIYPNDYDDLSDRNLVDLWLKKYPNDIQKVDLNQSGQSEIQNRRGGAFKYFLLIIILVVAFFSKPNFRDHKNSLIDKVLLPVVDNAGSELGIKGLSSLSFLGMDVRTGIKEYLDNSEDIVFKDYYLISMTEYDGQTITYGAFGTVYIPPQVKHELNKKMKSALNDTKSFFK